MRKTRIPRNSPPHQNKQPTHKHTLGKIWNIRTSRLNYIMSECGYQMVYARVFLCQSGLFFDLSDRDLGAPTPPPSVT